MAVNQSKVRSPRQWQQWLMSGAITDVRYQPGPQGFGTITFNRPATGREITAFYKKCGLALPTIEDLETFAKLINAEQPEPTPDPQPECVPFIEHTHDVVRLRWINDDWSNDIGFVLVSRD